MIDFTILSFIYIEHFGFDTSVENQKVLSNNKSVNLIDLAPFSNLVLDNSLNNRPARLDM